MHMSSYSDPNIKIPSNAKYIRGALGIVILISAVAGLAILLYFTNRPEPLNLEIVKERKAKLAEVNAKQDELISKYGWIDKPKGIVQIPIEQSMKLTVEALRNPKTVTKERTAKNADNQQSEG